MDLHSGAPYWLLRNGLAPSSTPLNRDEDCDVAIIGAGITGALLADALTSEGSNVVVLDRRELGSGSTAASSALLLFETDAELRALIEMVGERAAIGAYSAGREAIRRLECLTAELPHHCDFSRADSVYLASSRRHLQRLKDEATLRRSHGFDVDFLDRSALAGTLGVHAHGALRSPGAGRVDPLALTRLLLDRTRQRGGRVYGETTVTDWTLESTGATLCTSDGQMVRAGQVVVASGYEAPEIVPSGMVMLHSTFCLVTDRDEGTRDPLADVVMWESARPYAYLRSTPDGRLLIGGCDVRFKNAAVRDRLLPGKVPKLVRRLHELLPGHERPEAYSWCGTFAETKDSLPYIGRVPGVPCAWMALGYGGNGITFSAIAAEIITAGCMGRVHPDAEWFRPGR